MMRDRDWRGIGLKCGVAKSCPGTHTALQAPMLAMCQNLIRLHNGMTRCAAGQWLGNCAEHIHVVD